MDMLNDTKGIRHQATELIEQAYHKGYKAGVEDGRKLYEESGIFKPRNSAEIVPCDKFKKIIEFYKESIDASSCRADYAVGFRNGLRLAISYLDGSNPEYEACSLTCSDAVNRSSLVKSIDKLDNFEKDDRYNLGLHDAIKVIKSEPPFRSTGTVDTLIRRDI